MPAISKTEKPEFPDITKIGLAFAQAITYINYQPYPDLDERAREWLINTGTCLMRQLNSNLKILERYKDDRVNLPEWALDPEKHLTVQCPAVPYVLSKYKDQFVGCLKDLLQACGLNVETHLFFGTINYNIKFLEAGLRQTEDHKPKELPLGSDFMKRFYGTMSELKIEK